MENMAHIGPVGPFPEQLGWFRWGAQHSLTCLSSYVLPSKVSGTRRDAASVFRPKPLKPIGAVRLACMHNQWFTVTGHKGSRTAVPYVCLQAISHTRKSAFRLRRRTSSCGRLGPATQGSIFDKSISSTSATIASGTSTLSMRCSLSGST